MFGTLLQLYLQAWSRCTTFSGRASRREIWIFCGTNLPVAVALEIAFRNSDFWDPDVAIFFHLFYLLMPLPIAARRLHDSGRSAWWLYSGFLPPLGALVLVYTALAPGDAGENRFGPALAFRRQRPTEADSVVSRPPEKPNFFNGRGTRREYFGFLVVAMFLTSLVPFALYWAFVPDFHGNLPPSFVARTLGRIATMNMLAYPFGVFGAWFFDELTREGFLFACLGYALAVAAVPLTVRRLRDAGWSPAWVAMIIVPPYIDLFVLRGNPSMMYAAAKGWDSLVLAMSGWLLATLILLRPGEPGTNRYGPNPRDRP